MFYKSLQSELLMRIELATSSLPRKCSTTELQQQNWTETHSKFLILLFKNKSKQNLPDFSVSCFDFRRSI